MELAALRPIHVLVDGPPRCGKTALFRRAAGLAYHPAAGSVPGVDFVVLGNRVCLWDYNGPRPWSLHRFHALLRLSAPPQGARPCGQPGGQPSAQSGGQRSAQSGGQSGAASLETLRDHDRSRVERELAQFLQRK